MSILLNNKILQVTEQKIEAGLTPDNQDDYYKIVTAGMRVALDKGTDSIVARLKNSRDPVRDAAIGAVSITLTMKRHAPTMPERALVPAAMTLMLQALDFVDKAKIAKIGNTELVRATHIFANTIFNAFKITPAMLQKMAVKVHGVMKDPTQMEILARRAGVVKDPRASQPTNIPSGLPLANPKGVANGA